jgi:hypothetical protein
VKPILHFSRHPRPQHFGEGSFTIPSAALFLSWGESFTLCPHCRMHAEESP